MLQDDFTHEESVQPITSYLCKWNVPRKQKQSNLAISEATFRKHLYGRERKHDLKSMQDFDPRPVEMHGSATHPLKIFLDKVRGQDLGVSLLFDTVGAGPARMMNPMVFYLLTVFHQHFHLR